LGLVVPKISPIIGAAVYPVESTGVFESKKLLLRQSITKEQDKEEGEIYIRLRTQLRPGTDGVSSDWTDVNSAYDQQVEPVREKYKEILDSETERLVNDYTMRCNKQNAIARNIARLSPINAVHNLMAEFAGTGYTESTYFIKQASVYQEYVKQNYYDKMPIKTYKAGSNTLTLSETRQDLAKELPTFENYKRVGIAQIFQQNWIDIVLLGFYCLLFFVCGFISFLRFDVR
jgi:hypothetical protein